MTVGLNCKVTIWCMEKEPDDSVGGAMLSGTAAYTDVLARFSPQQPTVQFLEQGLETQRLWRVRIVPGTLVIYENDELELTYPTEHALYGHRFRILGRGDDSLHPGQGRAHIDLTVSRIVRSRA